MTPLDIAAAFQGGFAVLAHNYLECASTGMLQGVLAASALAGALSLVVREAASRRMYRRCEPIELASNSPLREALSAARTLIGAGSAPKLYWAPARGPSLATLGYLHPVIVISRPVAASLDREELEAALAHELGHVRRRDALRADLAAVLAALIAIGALFAIVLYFAFIAGAFAMNDAVAAAAIASGLALALATGKLMSEGLTLSAEFACDRAACAGSGGAAAVLSAMVKVARLEAALAGPPLAAAARFHARSAFDRRARLLLSAARQEQPRKSRRAAAAVLVCLLTLGMAAQARFGADCATCSLVTEKIDRWNGGEG